MDANAEAMDANAEAMDANAEAMAVNAEGIAPSDVRDLLRRAIVGILSDLDTADPSARDYRRKLAAALG